MNSIYYSNQSPLVSRLPGLNGNTNTIESSDISPNITQHKIEFENSNNSSKAINSNISPFQIALMNTMFANNNVQNLKFQGGSPRKSVMKNSSHIDNIVISHNDNMAIPEEKFENRKGMRKKFTCHPKLINPIACEEVIEEEEKKN